MAATDEKKRFECEKMHNGREVWDAPPGNGLERGLERPRWSLGGRLLVCAGGLIAVAEGCRLSKRAPTAPKDLWHQDTVRRLQKNLR